MSFSRFFIFTTVCILWVGSSRPAVASNEDKKEANKIPNSPSVQKVPAPAILETQRQLEDIIQIHKTLQLGHQKEIQEIQRIMEQARAHQRLLKELAEDKGLSEGASTSVTRLDIEQAIRAQKIQLIKEQTEKNRTAVEMIEKQVIEEKEKKKS